MENIRRLLPRARVVRLFLFVGIVWSAIIGPGSTVLILRHVGATNTQVGAVVAVFAVVSMVFQPVWGMLSDKLESPRKVLSFCLMGSVVFFGSVFFTTTLHIIIVLLFFDVVFRCGIVGLLDSHTLSETRAMPGLQYGHIRLAGSVFFGSLSLVYSFIIDNNGVMAIVPISVAIGIMACFYGFFIAKSKPDPGETKVKMAKGNLSKDIGKLFVNKRYLFLVLFIALSALAAQPLWMFLPTFVDTVGGSPSDVLLVQALRCVVEIPLFIFVGSFCKNVSSRKLMLAGASFMFVYIIMLFFTASLPMLIAAHLIGGVPAFIFGLTGRLRLLNESTPDSVRSTSITVMGTVELGLGAIIGNSVAGIILDNYSTRVLGAVSLVVFSVASAVLVFMSFSKWVREAKVVEK